MVLLVEGAPGARGRDEDDEVPGWGVDCESAWREEVEVEVGRSSPPTVSG